VKKPVKPKMAKGGLGKLKAPSIMVAIAIPKIPKVKVPKVKGQGKLPKK